MITDLKEVFPDVSVLYASTLLNEFKNDLERVIQELLKMNGGYPREEKSGISSGGWSGNTSKRSLKGFDIEVSGIHKIVCMHWLANHKKYLDWPLDFLARQAEQFNFHLFATVVYLERNTVVTEDGWLIFESKQTIRRLPYPRNEQKLVVKIDEDMQWEINALNDFLKTQQKRQQALFGGDELMKCPCCGDSFLFEEFLSCSEGCLTCEECLNSHLSGLVITGKMVSLKCISRQYCGGKGTYSEPFVKRALKYDPEIAAAVDSSLKEQERKRQEEVERQRSEETLLQIFPPPRRAQIKGAKLTVLLPSDHRFKLVSDYYTSTQGVGRIRAILAVERPQDTQRFAKYANSSNRFLLWHGTPDAPVVPILNTGLACNCRGMCFFASQAAMSNGYAQKAGAQTQYFMFVAEVHNAAGANALNSKKMVSTGLYIPFPGAFTASSPDQIHIRYLLVYTNP